ncbi:MAG: DUF4230 domain-containing protein [Dorea sp.]|jgi:hypothetical protein|nr:DUF4230 domain-containing protein [Dorea sp.]
MKKRYILLTVIAAAALIATGFLSARLLDKEKITVSASSIEERLSKCSSLTTARLDYRGMIKYEEGDIPYINKKSFSMIYDAHIKAGIDLSQAKVEVNGKKIKVTVPAPEIQDIVVSPDSLEFYDEKLALFNWTDREDTAKAMEYAEQDAAAKTSQTDILTQASDQAKTVINTLITPISDSKDEEYQIEFHETNK